MRDLSSDELGHVHGAGGCRHEKFEHDHDKKFNKRDEKEKHDERHKKQHNHCDRHFKKGDDD